MANKYTRKGRERGSEAAPGIPGATAVDDQFVSLWARAFALVEPHLGSVGYGLIALVAVLLGAWGVSGYLAGAREAATEHFGKAVRIYEADLLPAAKDEAKPDAKPEAKPEAKNDDEPPRFKTAKERADATLAELDLLQKKASGSLAAEAGAFRAGILYDQGNFAEAEKEFRKVADAAGKDDPLRVLAREGAALCLENQGKVDEALAIYKEIEGAGGGFFKDRAQFDQARALAAKGSKADAEKLLKDLLGRVPQGGFHEEIQNRLAALGG